MYLQNGSPYSGVERNCPKRMQVIRLWCEHTLHTELKTDTYTRIHTELKTDRQTHTNIHMQTSKQTDTHTHTYTLTHTDSYRQTHTEGEWQMDRYRDKEI